MAEHNATSDRNPINVRWRRKASSKSFIINLLGPWRQGRTYLLEKPQRRKAALLATLYPATYRGRAAREAEKPQGAAFPDYV